MALETVLAQLYQDRPSIDRIATEADIDIARLPVAGRPIDTWHLIIQEAQRQSRMAALAAIVMREYPHYAPLHLAIAETTPAAMIPPDPIPIRVGRLEQRVDGHESMLQRIMAQIDPGPRRRTAMAIFWGILAVLAASWLIMEFRQWYLANPVQAVGITAAAIIVAFIVRWLPEADRGQP